MNRFQASLLIVTIMMTSPRAWSAEPSADAIALVRDVEKMVHLQELAGWQLDEYEFRDLMPNVMNSICRVPREALGPAQGLLAARVIELGGDPETLLETPGTTLDSIADLLTVWRAKELLVRGIGAQEHCSFWIRRQPEFKGLHADEGRWSVSMEGGGLLLARYSADQFRFGAGGGGRLTVGYGFSPSWDLRVGLGMGGGALADSTVKAENVDIDFYMDMPVILRHSGVLWRQEVELSPVTMGIPWLDPLRFGLRVGGLVGLSYLRVGDVMPWAGLLIYSEYIFPRAGLPSAWTFRIGARFGFSWSPGPN